MFTIPSIWNIVISTIVFVVAAWYLHRVLDEHGMPKGFTRGLLVFVLAYVVSWHLAKWWIGRARKCMVQSPFQKHKSS